MAGFRSRPHRLESIQKLPLRHVDLLPCGCEVEPGGAIDFGKALEPAAARRPFDFECVADDCIDVQVELRRKGLDQLAAALADLAERLQWGGEPNAKLFAKFPPRYLFRFLPRSVLALGDGPRAFA